MPGTGAGDLDVGMEKCVGMAVVVVSVGIEGTVVVVEAVVAAAANAASDRIRFLTLITSMFLDRVVAVLTKSMVFGVLMTEEDEEDESDFAGSRRAFTVREQS